MDDGIDTSKAGTISNDDSDKRQSDDSDDSDDNNGKV